MPIVPVCCRADPLVDDMMTPQRTQLRAASDPQMGQLGGGQPPTYNHLPLTFLSDTLPPSSPPLESLELKFVMFAYIVGGTLLLPGKKSLEIDHCRNGDCLRAWNFLISRIGCYQGS